MAGVGQVNMKGRLLIETLLARQRQLSYLWAIPYRSVSDKSKPSGAQQELLTQIPKVSDDPHSFASLLTKSW